MANFTLAEAEHIAAHMNNAFKYLPSFPSSPFSPEEGIFYAHKNPDHGIEISTRQKLPPESFVVLLDCLKRCGALPALAPTRNDQGRIHAGLWGGPNAEGKVDIALRLDEMERDANRILTITPEMVNAYLSVSAQL